MNKRYRLVLIRVPAAAAGAPPDILCCLNRSTAPSLQWFCTHRTPGTFCLTGRWSQRARGSWTESLDAAAAWCAATR